MEFDDKINHPKLIVRKVNVAILKINQKDLEALHKKKKLQPLAVKLILMLKN